MINLLQKISNWKFILPFFLFCGYMSFYLFPQYQSQLTQLAGEEVKILDVRFSYSPSEVKSLFDLLGSEGRTLYKKVVGQVDMIYPITYGVLFTLVLAYLLKNLAGRNRKLILIALLPVLGALFDYLENFNTLKLLAQYPGIESQTVTWGELSTRIKHMMLFASVGLILLLAIALLIKTVARRKRNQHATSDFVSARGKV